MSTSKIKALICPAWTPGRPDVCGLPDERGGHQMRRAAAIFGHSDSVVHSLHHFGMQSKAFE
ncbi:MAG: hypothetical protein ACE361_03525 [Aureliella sp.]